MRNRLLYALPDFHKKQMPPERWHLFFIEPKSWIKKN